jgi:exodeoxyribonuclease V alpha subunit
MQTDNDALKEHLEGTLDRVIFKNESGFLIAAMTDKHNNKFSAIGTMVNPQTDMGYLLTGYWTESPKYGEQFKFTAYETQMPVDPRGIFNYIVRICRFVGSTVGNHLIDKYGERTLTVLKTDPERVSSEISGLTIDRAKHIQQTLIDNEQSERVMVELEALLEVPGMRKSLAGALYEEYKSDAAERVKANPYILTQFFGIGFQLADLVAIHIGFNRDSIERKRAAAIHCMNQNMQEGSTWMRRTDLLNEMNVLIQVHDLEEGIESLEEDDTFISDNTGGVDDVAYLSTSDKERYIAMRLAEMEAMRL